MFNEVLYNGTVRQKNKLFTITVCRDSETDYFEQEDIIDEIELSLYDKQWQDYAYDDTHYNHTWSFMHHNNSNFIHNNTVAALKHYYSTKGYSKHNAYLKALAHIKTDFEHFRQYLDDLWCYCTVSITLEETTYTIPMIYSSETMFETCGGITWYTSAQKMYENTNMLAAIITELTGLVITHKEL